MRIAIVLIAMVISSEAAQGQGIRFAEKQTRGGQVTVSEFTIDKDHLRTEDGTGEWSLFDGSTPIFYQMNSTRKAYAEFNRAALEQMQQDMIARLLANVPPEQRQAMEKALSAETLSARGGPSQPPISASIPSYRKIGSDKVGEWTCMKYEWIPPPPKPVPNVRATIDGGPPRIEVCLVAPESLGFTASDFAIIDTFDRFVTDTNPDPRPSETPRIGPYVTGVADGQPLSGIAVRRIELFVEEKITEMDRLRRETLPPATFVVPADYQKQSMLDYMRGMGVRVP